MPSPVKYVDMKLAQSILDGLTPEQFDNALNLCTHVANKYNEGLPAESHINYQLIKSRITNNNLKLHFPMPRGKRGRKPGTITSTEINRLRNGIRNRTNIKSSRTKNSDWSDSMKDQFDGNLLENVLAGRAKACVKAMCIRCFGGKKNRTHQDPPLAESIRNCTDTSCPLHIVRPYQN